MEIFIAILLPAVMIFFLAILPVTTLEAVKVDSEYIYIYRMRRLHQKISLSAVKGIRKSSLWEILTHRTYYPFLSVTIEYWDKEIQYIHPYNQLILLNLERHGRFFG